MSNQLNKRLTKLEQAIPRAKALPFNPIRMVREWDGKVIQEVTEEEMDRMRASGGQIIQINFVESKFNKAWRLSDGKGGRAYAEALYPELHDGDPMPTGLDWAAWLTEYGYWPPAHWQTEPKYWEDAGQ